LIDSEQRGVDANSDWGNSPDPLVLARATNAVGAFALPAGSGDAALARSVSAGLYTVQVGDGGGRTGEALVEIYDASAADPHMTNRALLRSYWAI
jgi:hypothetical protein